MRVDIRMLGGFEVVVDGRRVPAEAWRRRQAASLVKVLALQPEHRLPREQLIDLLWPDLLVDEAAPRLHKAAHYARTALGVRGRRRSVGRDGLPGPGRGRHDRRRAVRGERGPAGRRVCDVGRDGHRPLPR